MKDAGKENITEKMKHQIHMSIIVLAMLAICFAGMFNRDLFTPDEPREAAISLEMSKNGNFIIPHLANAPFIEKPPLYYIFNAWSIKLAGPLIGNTNALRLVIALFGVGTLLMTFFLARIFFGNAIGFLAAAILATMPGFVENFHWIRVDGALCFFVVAAVWCFAETYVNKKPWYCVFAGLFTAGAFLTKGLIGPILVAIPWAGLFFVWMRNLKKTGIQKKDLFIGYHVLCLICVVLLSGTWAILLRVRGGEDLWYQWFWVNHVGRLLGTSTAKSHIRTGKPFYYVAQLVVYSIPWFPLVIVWAWSFFRDSIKRQRLPAENIFMFIWGFGGLLLLSVSATKRGIYMVPVLPVFALMCAAAVKQTADNKGLKGYFLFWIALCASFLAILVVLPVFKPVFSHKLSADTVNFLGSFSLRNLWEGLGVIVCVYLFYRYKMNSRDSGAIVLATVVLFIGLFIIPLKAVNMEKSMRADIVNFTNRIPIAQRPHVAAYGFNETMTGCFYYYADWPIKQLDDANQVRQVISGKDTEFHSVIIGRDQPGPQAIEFIDRLVKMPYKLLAEQYTGNKRGIFWIEGTK